MTAREIGEICRRHGIPENYWMDYCSLVLHGRITSRKFSRLARRKLNFAACLEEIRDVLSRPYRHFFEPPRFESLEIE